MRSRNRYSIIIFGFFLRTCVAGWNGFWGPSFGAGADAADFHSVAAAYSKDMVLAEFKIGQIQIYSQMLGVVYFVTTPSLFIGSILSVIAWVTSALLLVKSMSLLSVERTKQFKAMLIYAVLPSSVLFGSVTLRESYQLLFVNLAVYSALKIYLAKSITHWLTLFGAVLGMGMLHGALLAFGVFVLIAVLILLAFRESNGFLPMRLVFVVPLVAFVVIYGPALFSNVSYGLNDGLAMALESYNEGGLAQSGRAFYRDSATIGGNMGLLLFVPVSLFQYLFEPMPWRISSAYDIEALCENILRAWLIWKALVGLWKMPTRARQPVLFVFLSYLALESIWSIGTSNWGTALRHHIPSIGLLLIAAFAYSGKLSSNTNVRAAARVYRPSEGDQLAAARSKG